MLTLPKGIGSYRSAFAMLCIMRTKQEHFKRANIAVWKYLEGNIVKKISGKLRPGKVRKPVSYQTAKPPKQRNTEKLAGRSQSQSQPTARVWSILKGLKEAWFWASLPLVVVSTIYNIEPHIQISASTNQDDTSSFGTLIAVTNSGHVPINDVQMSCLVNAGDVRNHDKVIMSDVGITKLLARHMSAGKSVTDDCGIRAPGLQERAKIKVMVTYRWAWGALSGSDVTVLSSEVDAHGRSFMIPTDH